MSKIRLEDGTIFHEGQWLSVEDLAQKIKEKIGSGDMKFSTTAAALEELKVALENTQTISVTLTITKDEYEKLKTIGGKDDSDCARKAVLTYIGVDLHSEISGQPDELSPPPPASIQESDIPSKQEDEKKPRYKDHFLG